jgi:2-oxo-4-hydroxy-4-carboxy-5-ureidoimidazoline decarboxylase
VIDPSKMTSAAFVEAFGHVYEHSQWIAELAHDRGLTDSHDGPAALAALLAQVLDEGSDQQKLQLLCAHPDLAGKLAMRGELTDASTSEQSSARLDQCSEGEFEKFTALNSRYKNRFGFPFILAVRDHDRASILRLFELRAGNSESDEFAEALKQVNRIAALRIADVFQAGGEK